MVTAGLRPLACATVAVIASGLLVGCSTNSPEPRQQPRSLTPSRQEPTSQPPETGGPTNDPYPALCRKIVAKDVQALYRTPIGPMTTGGSSDCQFAPRGSDSDIDTLKVYLRVDDGDKTLYDHVGDISYGTFEPLAGVGYQAKWGSTPGSAPTVVDVRNGHFTCTVIPPYSIADLTLTHSGTVATPHVSHSAAAAYAARIAMICRDVFATSQPSG